MDDAVLKVIAVVLIVLAAGYLIFLVLTDRIDLKKTFRAPFERLVTFKKEHNPDVQIEQIGPSRISLDGSSQSENIGLLIYDLKVANTLGEPITMKQVLLRYKWNGKVRETDSNVMRTGKVESSGDDALAIEVPDRHANIIVMGWKNLRTVIGEMRPIPPGGVLSGSAIYVLDFSDPNELAKIDEFQLVFDDYSGNRTIHAITRQEKWIDQARTTLIRNRPFTVDGRGGPVIWATP
jgi:hypothetical protein